MTVDKLFMNLTANSITATLTNLFQRTRLITPSTEKHHSLDSEDDFRSGCRNDSHQQQFFSELPSPRRSQYTNYLTYVIHFRTSTIHRKESKTRTKVNIAADFDDIRSNTLHCVLSYYSSRYRSNSVQSTSIDFSINSNWYDIRWFSLFE